MGSTSKRKVPMEVLSLGMGRTGTCSMREALHILGVRHTYHGFDTFDSPGDFLYWEKAADAKFYGKGKPYGREEFDEFLGHCAGTTDLPALFAEDMIAAYPEVSKHKLFAKSPLQRMSRVFRSACTYSAFRPKWC
jgi:hypothetical protein